MRAVPGRAGPGCGAGTAGAAAAVSHVAGEPRARTCLRGEGFLLPRRIPAAENSQPAPKAGRRKASSERARRENFRGDDPSACIPCHSRCQPSRNAGGELGWERVRGEVCSGSVRVCVCARNCWGLKKSSLKPPGSRKAGSAVGGRERGEEEAKGRLL